MFVELRRLSEKQVGLPGGVCLRNSNLQIFSVVGPVLLHFGGGGDNKGMEPAPLLIDTAKLMLKAAIEASPAVMTAEEACHYLRLDEGRSLSAALEALNHLVSKRKVHPVKIGRHRRYSRRELDRFVDDATLRYPPPKKS